MTMHRYTRCIGTSPMRRYVIRCIGTSYRLACHMRREVLGFWREVLGFVRLEVAVVDLPYGEGARFGKVLALGNEVLGFWSRW